MSKKLFVLINISDPECEEVYDYYESMDDLHDNFYIPGNSSELKDHRIREYDLVKEHKLKIVTETITVEKQVKKIALK
jgi:hypothetical protein